MSVYFAQHRPGELIKIGHSISVRARLAELGIRNLLGSISGNKTVEKQIHKKFSHLRVHGEWFEPADELLEFIRVEAQSHTPDVTPVERCHSIRIPMYDFEVAAAKSVAKKFGMPVTELCRWLLSRAAADDDTRAAAAAIRMNREELMKPTSDAIDRVTGRLEK